MSLRFKVSTFAGGLAAAMVVLVLSSPATAAPYYWDGSGNDSLQDSGGTWDNGTTSNWVSGGGDIPWVDGNTAVFGSGSPGGGAYTVTLGGNVQPANITFNNPGYTIAPDANNLYSLTAGSNGMTVQANVPGTITAPISGTGLLTVQGNNALTLNGNVNCSGGLTVTGGDALVLNGNLSGAGGMTVSSSTTVTVNGNLSFAGSLTVSSGTVVLAGTNSFGGIYSTFPNNANGNATVVNAGAVLSFSSSANLPQPNPNWLWQNHYLLQLNGGTLLYTGTGTTDFTNLETYTNNATIDVANSGANFSFDWYINGGNGFTKTGPGTLTLRGGGGGIGASVLQGTLVLATPSGQALGGGGVQLVSPGATLQIGAAGGAEIWGGGINNMNGTFDLNGFNMATAGGNLLTGSGTITNSAGNSTSTLTVGYIPNCATGGSGTFAGLIADGAGKMALAVAYNTTELTLTGTSNAYSGGTAISAGTLQIGDGSTSPGSLPGNVVVSNSAAGALIFNTPAAMSLTASGNISGSGGLTKIGAGTALFSGVNSYTGPTYLSAGVLEATTTAALPAFAGSGSLNVAGIATLAVQAQSANAPNGWTSANLSALMGNSNVVFNSGSSLGVDVVGSDTASVNTAFVPAGVNMTKLGSGGLVLGPSSTYSGATTVNAGTLIVNGALASTATINAGGLLGGTGSFGGTITANSGATLAPGNSLGAGTLSAAGLSLYGGSALDFTLSGTPANNSFINDSSGQVRLRVGTETVNIVGTSVPLGTYPLISYSTTAGVGSLVIGTVPASLSGDTFTFTSIGNVMDLIIASSSTVNGAWATNGSGTWSTSSNWTGGVPAVSPDTATFGPGLTSGPATVTLDSSRSLASLTFNTTGANSYTLNASGASTLTLTNATFLSVGATLVNSGGSQTINVPLVLGSNLYVSAAQGSVLTIANSISETAPGGKSLNVSGGGQVVLSGTSSYSGGTNVLGGTLIAATTAALPSYSNVSVSGGATLGVRVGGTGEWQASDITSLVGAATFNSGSLLGFDTTDGNFTYAGNLPAGAGLAKLGGNLLALSGNINATGPSMFASGGTVQLSGNSTFAGNMTGGGTTITLSNYADSHTGGTATTGGGNSVYSTTVNGYTYYTIGGQGSTLVINGGTTTLQGANTYAGFQWDGWNNHDHIWITPTIINTGGVLSISSSTNLPWCPTATIYQDDSPLQISGGTLLYTGAGAGSTDLATSFSGNGTIDVLNPGANFIFGWSIGGTFYKTGSGAMTLTSGDGGVGGYVQQGTLVLGGPGNVFGWQGGQMVSTLNSVSPGATLQLGAGIPASSGLFYFGVTNMNGTFDLHGDSVGLTTLTGSGTIANAVSGGTSTLIYGWVPYYSNSPSNTFAGVLSDGAGVLALTVTGAAGNTATLTLTGTSNTYSGGTAILGNGILKIGDGSTSPGSLPGNVVIGSTMAGALTFNTPSGMSVTGSGNISGSGGLAKTGSGLLILSGDNTYMGGTDVEGGTLDVAVSDAMPYGSGLTVGANGTVVFAVPPEAGSSTLATASPAGQVAAVPEPGTLALLAVALWSAAIYRRFRRPKAF